MGGWRVSNDAEQRSASHLAPSAKGSQPSRPRCSFPHLASHGAPEGANGGRCHVGGWRVSNGAEQRSANHLAPSAKGSQPSCPKARVRGTRRARGTPRWTSQRGAACQYLTGAVPLPVRHSVRDEESGDRCPLGAWLVRTSSRKGPVRAQGAIAGRRPGGRPDCRRPRVHRGDQDLSRGPPPAGGSGSPGGMCQCSARRLTHSSHTAIPQERCGIAGPGPAASRPAPSGLRGSCRGLHLHACGPGPVFLPRKCNRHRAEAHGSHWRGRGAQYRARAPLVQCGYQPRVACPSPHARGSASNGDPGAGARQPTENSRLVRPPRNRACPQQPHTQVP